MNRYNVPHHNMLYQNPLLLIDEPSEDYDQNSDSEWIKAINAIHQKLLTSTDDAQTARNIVIACEQFALTDARVWTETARNVLFFGAEPSRPKDFMYLDTQTSSDGWKTHLLRQTQHGIPIHPYMARIYVSRKQKLGAFHWRIIHPDDITDKNQQLISPEPTVLAEDLNEIIAATDGTNLDGVALTTELVYHHYRIDELCPHKNDEWHLAWMVYATYPNRTDQECKPKESTYVAHIKREDQAHEPKLSLVEKTYIIDAHTQKILQMSTTSR